MSRFRHIIGLHLARKSFVFAGAFLLALLSLHKSAQAGCGDYVFIRNAQGHLVRASSLMKNHASEGECSGPNCPNNNPLATPIKERLPPQLPCHGPNCSGESQFPAAPVPSPAPLQNSQESTALLLNWKNATAEGDPGIIHPSSDTDDELRNPQPIFHPPR